MFSGFLVVGRGFLGGVGVWGGFCGGVVVFWGGVLGFFGVLWGGWGLLGFCWGCGFFGGVLGPLGFFGELGKLGGGRVFWCFLLGGGGGGVGFFCGGLLVVWWGFRGFLWGFFLFFFCWGCGWFVVVCFFLWGGGPFRPSRRQSPFSFFFAKETFPLSSHLQTRKSPGAKCFIHFLRPIYCRWMSLLFI